MLFIADILSRHVHWRSLELGRILHSEWIHPGRQVTELFWKADSFLGVSARMGKFSKELCSWSAGSAHPQVALLRPCSQLAYPSQWALREVSVPFQAEVPSLGEFFHFQGPLLTLINWKLCSFGPLGICVLPLKRTVILAKKKTWKLFICRALWPSPTFEL